MSVLLYISRSIFIYFGCPRVGVVTPPAAKQRTCFSIAIAMLMATTYYNCEEFTCFPSQSPLPRKLAKRQEKTHPWPMRGASWRAAAEKNSNTQIQKGWKSVCFGRHCQ